MPRRKQLKTNGRSILSYSVNIENIKSKHANVMIDIIALNVNTNDGEFSYSIHSDTRAPDLAQIKAHIEKSIQTAMTDSLNVEISEYSERDYLFFNVQKANNEQYSGQRV